MAPSPLTAADRAATDYSRWLAERALLRYQFANKPDLDALLVGWFWPLSPLTRDVMQFHYFQRFRSEARGQ